VSILTSGPEIPPENDDYPANPCYAAEIIALSDVIATKKYFFRGVIIITTMKVMLTQTNNGNAENLR